MIANSAMDFIKLLRPHQWIKNGFVFIGLLFSHMWTDLSMVLSVVLAAVAFSIVSSAVYIVNDIVDCKNDRAHPVKKNRPIASGNISITKALIFAPMLFSMGFFLGWLVSGSAFIFLVSYALMNLCYSFGLKRIVILDVFIISAGFLLRVFVGTVGVGIEPSQWLLLTSLMLTLFLGFAKRRAELISLDGQKNEYRRVLEQYSPALLDNMISVTAACTLMAYGLYTMSPDTIDRHGSKHLILTLPFLTYALFRYIYLLHHQRKGAEPSREIFTDPHILISIFGWVILLGWLIK